MPETTTGRGALRVLQTGAIAIVLAAATYKLFELDRYFVPKELVLHLTALAATIACVRGGRRLELTRSAPKQPKIVDPKPVTTPTPQHVIPVIFYSD